MSTPNGISGTVQVDGSIKYINQRGKDINDTFQRELIDRAKQLSKQIQQDLSKSVDGGAVPFTNNSVLFKFQKHGSTGVTVSILVKNLQAKYLYDVIVQPSVLNKIVPTSKAKLSKQGNIRGLKANLASKKYIIVKSKNGKKRLIDTSQKKRDKRVIGIKENKKRKMIYDFYQETEKGFMVIINDIKGKFVLKRG